jgi:hypothetical protein
MTIALRFGETALNSLTAKVRLWCNERYITKFRSYEQVRTPCRPGAQSGPALFHEDLDCRRGSHRGYRRNSGVKQLRGVSILVEIGDSCCNLAACAANREPALQEQEASRCRTGPGIEIEARLRAPKFNRSDLVAVEATRNHLLPSSGDL